jgi:hypothetical protein
MVLRSGNWCGLYRRREVLGLLVGACFAAGLGDRRGAAEDDGAPARGRVLPPGAPAGLLVEAEACTSASFLHVAYRLCNAGSRDVGLLTRIGTVALDGGIRFDPSTVYVDLEGTTLVLRRHAPALPGGGVAARVGLTLLRAGESVHESLVLPIPVPVCDPARRARRIRGQPGTEVVARDPRRVASVALVLGAAELDPLWRLVGRSAEHPDVFDPGRALPRQSLLEASLPLDRRVEALDYETVRIS